MLSCERSLFSSLCKSSHDINHSISFSEPDDGTGNTHYMSIILGCGLIRKKCPHFMSGLDMYMYVGIPLYCMTCSDMFSLVLLLLMFVSTDL